MVEPQERRKLQQKYPTEQVFIVPFQRAQHIADGLTRLALTEKEEQKKLIAWEKDGRFVARCDAEGNDAFCQLIPYTMVFSPDYRRIFVARRIAGDSRLVSQYSLGFGGHINPCDSRLVVRSAAWRELGEELDLGKPSPLKFIGYIRELASKTHEHLGFVYAITASSAGVRETGSLQGEWMDIAQLVDAYYRFEGWSRKLIDYMFVISRDERLWEAEE